MVRKGPQREATGGKGGEKMEWKIQIIKAETSDDTSHRSFTLRIREKAKMRYDLIVGSMRLKRKDCMKKTFRCNVGKAVGWGPQVVSGEKRGRLGEPLFFFIKTE